VEISFIHRTHRKITQTTLRCPNQTALSQKTNY